MTRLAGLVGLITGAARGQGRSHAVCFADEGADLVLLDIGEDLGRGVTYEMASDDQLEETARRCRELGRRVETIRCDVRDAAAVDAAVATALDQFGKIDVLINNAGITTPAAPVHELDEDGWSVMLDVNLSGPWRMAKAVLPKMIERQDGCIINISSAAGLRAYPSNAAYIASKHGVIGLTKSLAVDYGGYGIRANAICPGTVRDDPDLDSRMVSALAEQWGVAEDRVEEEFSAFHLLPRLMTSRDISRACVWLASDDGRNITGSILPVDAGSTAR